MRKAVCSGYIVPSQTQWRVVRWEICNFWSTSYEPKLSCSSAIFVSCSCWYSFCPMWFSRAFGFSCLSVWEFLVWFTIYKTCLSIIHKNRLSPSFTLSHLRSTTCHMKLFNWKRRMVSRCIPIWCFKINTCQCMCPLWCFSTEMPVSSTCFFI